MDARLQKSAAMLVALNLLNEEEALKYQIEAASNLERFIPYIVKHNILTAQSIALCFCKQFNLEFINLDDIPLNTIPQEFIQEHHLSKYQILPLSRKNNQLIVAIDDPAQQIFLKEIQFSANLPIIPMVAESDKLSAYITALLQEKEHVKVSNFIDRINPKSNLRDNLEVIQNDDAPIISFVNRILNKACISHASDIHFETYFELFRIRYRIDGILYEIEKPPLHLAARINARIKILANLDISEKRLPQDGQFRFVSKSNHTIDCRVSTCPTRVGEKIVIRLLNQTIVKPNLKQLELSSKDYTILINALNREQGLILVTGPTGSGKTMTLFSAIDYLNTPEKNISTVEDPIEIKLSGINQVEINPKIGLTFQTILRSFLRQDPDVIMLGEIRDPETADLALKAAQTGHLVLATIHAKHTLDTFARMRHLNVDEFDLLHNLSLIIAQRLVRRLCQKCKSIQDCLSEAELNQFNLTTNFFTEHKIYQAKGCAHCTNGYQGQVALFEMLTISDAIKELLSQTNYNPSSMLKIAQQEGMLTLREAGLLKIQQGVTSFSELRRIL